MARPGRVGVDRFVWSLVPPFARSEFWFIQALVVGITLIHALVENFALVNADFLEAILVSLYLLPVAYAATVFGLHGAAVTAVWVVLLTLPNAFLWHTGPERVAEFWQAAFVVGIGVLVGHRVDREQRVRREIAQKDRDRQQLVEEYSRKLLLAREQERTRIAQDLHDGPLQSAIVLWRKLDPCDQPPTEAVHAKLRSAQGAVEDLAAELRGFSRDLRPPVLKDLGLLAALRAETAGFERRTGITTVFLASGSEPAGLSGEAALMLFRVCQEALRNVERHAQAGQVLVDVEAGASTITVRIKDDGCGITELPTPAELLSENRLGIVGMVERARLVGGTCELRGGRSQGTTVEVAVPLA